jgi:hypothetical protein
MAFGSDFLPQLYTVQYSTLLDLRLQQMQSKLRGKVREEACVGKAHSLIQYTSAFNMEAPPAPFSPLGRTDVQFMRRWVFPSPKENNFLVDTYEQLQTMISPQSAYIKDVAASIGRAWDDALISAVFGSSTIGTDPGGFTTETWANAQNTATGSNTGLTIADTYGNGSTTIGMTVRKLLKCRQLFRHLHVDLDAEPLYLVIGSQQEMDLLSQTQVVSDEFNDRPVLVDGRLQQFLGFNIIVSERLPVASSIRQCFAFVPSGLALGLWRDLFTDVSIRKDISGHPVQIYSNTMFGATRLEPGRVIEIDAGNDSVGNDNI